MRIQSDFKDYYDCGMQYGFDLDFKYLRYSKEILINRPKMPKRFQDSSRWSYGSWHTNSYDTDILIGFCGKIYYGRMFFGLNGKITDVYYPEDGIDYRPDEHRHFIEMNPRSHFQYLDYLFDEFKCPVFTIKNFGGCSWKKVTGLLTINDCLKKYFFQRVASPIDAYQQIRMYLGNMAMPEKPIPAIANNDMIEAKGFDLKSSFRKGKT